MDVIEITLNIAEIDSLGLMATIKSSTCPIIDLENVWNMVEERQTKITGRFKGYFMKNWGLPFLVGFMVLLIGAPISDNFAVFAFYSLVIGVVLQLACFFKYDKKVDAVEAIS